MYLKGTLFWRFFRFFGRRHWRLGLRLSLILHVLLPMGVVAALGAGWAINTFERQVEQQMQRDLERVARAIELPLRHALQRDREGSIVQALKSVFAMSHVYSAYLYDADGRMLPGSGTAGDSDPTPAIARAEVTERAAEGERHGEYATEAGRAVYAYFVPLTDAGGRVTGLLQLTRRYSDFEERIRTVRFQAAGAFLLTFMALAAIVVTGHHRVFGLQLNHLASSMSRIAAGDRSHRYRPAGPREIRALGTHFNRMMDDITRAETEILQQRQQQRRLATQLRQSEKLAAIGQLAAGVAHELGNPLSLVDAKSQRALRNGGERPEAMRSALGDIRREVDRMTRIIRQLLDFSRRRPVEKRKVDAGRLLGDALASVRSEAENTGTKLVHSPGPSQTVLADPLRVEQALVNLLRNAIQAAGDGTVRASWKTDSNCLTFEIRDNGPGIPESCRAKIFEPFFTTKSVGEGTGLGLAVVHGIAEEHGGRVTVASAAEGGACFQLMLPLQPKDNVNS